MSWKWHGSHPLSSKGWLKQFFFQSQAEYSYRDLCPWVGLEGRSMLVQQLLGTRSPRVDCRVDGMINVDVNADQRLWCSSTSTDSRSVSARYGDAVPWRQQSYVPGHIAGMWSFPELLTSGVHGEVVSHVHFFLQREHQPRNWLQALQECVRLSSKHCVAVVNLADDQWMNQRYVCMCLRFIQWHTRWSKSSTRRWSCWCTWCQAWNVAVCTMTTSLLLTCSVTGHCELLLLTFDSSIQVVIILCSSIFGVLSLEGWREAL